MKPPITEIMKYKYDFYKHGSRWVNIHSLDEIGLAEHANRLSLPIEIMAQYYDKDIILRVEIHIDLEGLNFGNKLT